MYSTAGTGVRHPTQFVRHTNLRNVKVQQPGQVMLQVFQHDIQAAPPLPVCSWGVFLILIIVFLYVGTTPLRVAGIMPV